MSNKKHKGDHGKRAEKRAAARAQETVKNPATAQKPRRVYLRNAVYIWATAAIVVGVVALLVVLEWLGFWDTVIGSVLSVLVGAFGCMCVYDLALLLTACITFGEGMVNAGKNEQGQLMLFHAASVVRVEVRGTDGKVMAEGLPLYKNAVLTFVMESGRTNQRKVSRLTAKQLTRVQQALEAERKANGNGERGTHP